MDDIDLIQRKRQVGRRQFGASNQGGDCLQGAINHAGMKDELTEIAFQMVWYLQLGEGEGAIDVNLLYGLERGTVLQTVLAEFPVKGSRLLRTSALRFQGLNRNVTLSIGARLSGFRPVIAETQPAF